MIGMTGVNGRPNIRPAITSSKHHLLDRLTELFRAAVFAAGQFTDGAIHVGLKPGFGSFCRSGILRVVVQSGQPADFWLTWLPFRSNEYMSGYMSTGFIDPN